MCCNSGAPRCRIQNANPSLRDCMTQMFDTLSKHIYRYWEIDEESYVQFVT